MCQRLPATAGGAGGASSVEQEAPGCLCVLAVTGGSQERKGLVFMHLDTLCVCVKKQTTPFNFNKATLLTCKRHGEGNVLAQQQKSERKINKKKKKLWTINEF